MVYDTVETRSVNDDALLIHFVDLKNIQLVHHDIQYYELLIGLLGGCTDNL